MGASRNDLAKIQSGLYEIKNGIYNLLVDCDKEPNNVKNINASNAVFNNDFYGKWFTQLKNEGIRMFDSYIDSLMLRLDNYDRTIGRRLNSRYYTNENANAIRELKDNLSELNIYLKNQINTQQLQNEKFSLEDICNSNDVDRKNILSAINQQVRIINNTLFNDRYQKRRNVFEYLNDYSTRIEKNSYSKRIKKINNSISELLVDVYDRIDNYFNNNNDEEDRNANQEVDQNDVQNNVQDEHIGNNPDVAQGNEEIEDNQNVSYTGRIIEKYNLLLKRIQIELGKVDDNFPADYRNALVDLSQRVANILDGLNVRNADLSNDQIELPFYNEDWEDEANQFINLSQESINNSSHYASLHDDLHKQFITLKMENDFGNKNLLDDIDNVKLIVSSFRVKMGIPDEVISPSLNELNELKKNIEDNYINSNFRWTGDGEYRLGKVAEKIHSCKKNLKDTLNDYANNNNNINNNNTINKYMIQNENLVNFKNRSNVDIGSLIYMRYSHASDLIEKYTTNLPAPIDVNNPPAYVVNPQANGENMYRPLNNSGGLSNGSFHRVNHQ